MSTSIKGAPFRVVLWLATHPGKELTRDEVMKLAAISERDACKVSGRLAGVIALGFVERVREQRGPNGKPSVYRAGRRQLAMIEEGKR